MRERTTWSRQTIASQLRKVAEDPRAMNQDHIQQQPAADAYVIGGPSEFAEDLSPSGPGWKADLDGSGNTKRDEIGFPEYRKDTFNNPEKAPGVSPSRQASSREIHARAEVATKVARLMLSKNASETAIENQALVLMDLPLANLQNTLSRLAQDQDQGGDDDDDGDDGQQKQAADDDDDDSGEQKQAGELPKEFLENIQKKKDEAKDKDGDKDKGGKDKEARARRAQQQEEETDSQQGKQARSRRAQQDEDADQGQEKEARSRRAQQQGGDDEDDGQQKQARSRRAQQQDDGGEDGQQSKQARRVKAQDQDADDDGQQKQAQEQQAEEEKQVGKEAYALIKQAAAGLLAMPVTARNAAFKVMLPSLAKVAFDGMNQQSQQQIGQDQIQAQVQQLVQQAMQQQQQAQQQPQAQDQVQSQQQLQSQQQQIADQQLVDQMLQDGPTLAEDQIQLDAPDMDLGLADEDPALQAIFASDAEVQRALEAQQITSGHQLTAARTASTRTVGTRPSAGVSQLGGMTTGGGSGAEEISKLSGMWSSAPDVSSVFRS